MAGNSSLSRAREAREDEFYTQLTDIEKELRYYRRHFKGKTVLCNCDDPFESNFFKYFALNFNKLGLKKLIATSYDGSPIAGTQLQFPGMETPLDPQARLLHVGPTGQVPYKAVVTHVEDATGDGAVNMLDIAELFKLGENKLSVLDGHSGDESAVQPVQGIRAHREGAREEVRHHRESKRHHIQGNLPAPQRE